MNNVDRGYRVKLWFRIDSYATQEAVIIKTPDIKEQACNFEQVGANPWPGGYAIHN